MINKGFLSISIIIAFPALADYNAFLKKNIDTSYSVGTLWADTGDVYDCSNGYPETNDIYHDIEFSQNNFCKQDQSRILDGKTEIRTVNKEIEIIKSGTLYPTSCLDELNLGYSIESGIHDITFNGNIISVYCDMTTDGGGWTNVNVNFGDIQALSTNNGLSSSGTSNNFLNGSMVRKYNNTCTNTTYTYTSLTEEFINKFSFDEVKMTAKSYGSGDIRCGGILRNIPAPNLTRFGSFRSGALYRCDNNDYYSSGGSGFSEETNQSYLSFKYQWTEDRTRNVFSTSADCGVGYTYHQVQSFMVR